MWEAIRPRLEELARRAGARGMPAPAVLGALVVCAFAVVWAAWRWWPVGDGGESRELAAPVDAQSASVEPSVTATPSAPAVIVVHVSGRVRRPGVYELPDGSRVNDAVDAAGGPVGDADPDALNLARVLADGEQVVVGRKGERVPVPAAAAAGGSAGGAAPAGATVNVNTADAAALDELPGVGPSTAQKIIDEREANGPFSSVEDLGRVSGIGPKKLEALKDSVSVR